MSAPETFVAFRWGAEPVAVPAAEVATIVDHPPLAALPAPFMGIHEVVACAGELCPVVETPVDPEAAAPRYVVLLDRSGNVAIRVRAPIEVRIGRRDGEVVAWEDEDTATLRTRRRWLADLSGREA